MPFARPTLTELAERARDDLDGALPGADSRLRRSALEVLGRVHAGGLHGLYGYLDWLARQVIPDTAEQEYLERWAGVWGVARRAPAQAAGAAVFTGAEAAVVPAGSLLQRGDGVEYLTAAEAVIDGGSAEAAIEAVEPGLAGNAEAGTALQLVSPIAGVNAQAAVAEPGASGGADQEDDAQLLERLLLRVQEPPQGGAAHDYVQWARQVPGVTRVWVYPDWVGRGTVGVTFTMDGKPDDIIPTEIEVGIVAAHLEPLRPVTAELFVFAPVPTPLDLSIELTPDTAAVRAAVEAEVADWLARDAEPGAVLRLSRLSEAISAAPGEQHHRLVSPSADKQHGPGELAVPGSITWVSP